MLTRTHFEWDVTLQTETGQTLQRRFRSFWDPAHDLVTSESVAKAAAATEYVASGKQHRVAGIAAQLVTDERAAA